MARIHGFPIWFDLSTSDLAAAGDFYGSVLDWQIADAGMEGFTYHLATARGAMVAGLMATPEGMEMAPAWSVYFGVDDADRAAEAIKAAGGQVLAEPADIPGTGRFAVTADPQGAAFGILCPAPMADDGGARPFDQQKPGHGNWTELMSTDPKAGFGFYSGLFGWTAGEAMDMGEMGTYQLFRHDGTDIGAMMGLGDAPRSCWMVYFGVNGVNPAIDRIRAGGGTIRHGPVEVPGGAHIAVATDPQGAWFAVVGPLETA